MVIQCYNNHSWFLYTGNSRKTIGAFSLWYGSSLYDVNFTDVFTFLKKNVNHRLDCKIEKRGSNYYIMKLNFIFYPVVEQVLLVNNKEVLRFAGTASRYKKEIERFSSMCVNLEYKWVSEIKNVIVRDYREGIEDE